MNAEKIVKVKINNEWLLLEEKTAVQLYKKEELQGVGATVYSADPENLVALEQQTQVPLHPDLLNQTKNVKQAGFPDGHDYHFGTFVIITTAPLDDEELVYTPEEIAQDAEEKLVRLSKILQDNPEIIPIRHKEWQEPCEVFEEAFHYIVAEGQPHLVSRHPVPVPPDKITKAIRRWCSRIECQFNAYVVVSVDVTVPDFSLPLPKLASVGRKVEELTMKDFFAGMTFRNNKKEELPEIDLADMLTEPAHGSGSKRLGNEIVRINQGMAESTCWRSKGDPGYVRKHRIPGIMTAYEQLLENPRTFDRMENLRTIRKSLKEQLQKFPDNAMVDVMNLMIQNEFEILTRYQVLINEALNNEDQTGRIADIDKGLDFVRLHYMTEYERTQKRLVDIITQRAKVQHLKALRDHRQQEMVKEWEMRNSEAG